MIVIGYQIPNADMTAMEDVIFEEHEEKADASDAMTRLQAEQQDNADLIQYFYAIRLSDTIYKHYAVVDK